MDHAMNRANVGREAVVGKPTHGKQHNTRAFQAHLYDTSRMTGSLAERWAAVKEFFAQASSAALEYRSPNR